MTADVRPPAHVQPYVDALGVETAVTFLLHFGGADLYIPKEPKGGSEIVTVLGMDGARALSDLAARTRLQFRVPLAKPWIARHMAFTRGLSKAEIARKLHATVPTVTVWLRGGPPRAFPDPRQPSLF